MKIQASQLQTTHIQPKFGLARRDQQRLYLPDPEQVMDKDFIRQNLPEFPFDQAFASSDKKAELSGNYLIDTRRFILELTRSYIDPALHIEKLQEHRMQLKDGDKALLDAFEGLLPADVRRKGLKADVLHRILYTNIAEKWEKKLLAEPQQSGYMDTPPGSLGQLMQNLMNPKALKSDLDVPLKQLFTGFISKYDSKLDRHSANFFDYLLSCEGKPGVSPEINESAAFIRHIRKEVSEAAKAGKLIRPLDENTQDGLQQKLSELYDTTKPASQRLMTEEQYQAVEMLLKALHRYHPADPSQRVVFDQLHTILFKVPWTATPQASYTIPSVKAVLDNDHYGLEDVKEKIIDFVGKDLHLKNLREQGIPVPAQSKPKILFLVGAPGVGKTSIGQSIANSMGRKFIKVSLNGVSDAGEIHGHRSAYVGATWGRIVDALIQAKCTNPVIMLDEIDKMGVNPHHGDPRHALLSVLDPVQNKAFRELYLKIPVDLSKVTFVCTANGLDNIPAPLLDRMQICELKGYTSTEKIHIAKQYLIPRAREENGLKKEHLGFTKEPFDIPDETLKYLITNYAPDRGARRLTEHINTIAEKTAARLAGLGRKPTPADFPPIKPEDLMSYLKQPRQIIEIVDPTPLVGRVNALWYSEGGRPGGIGPMDIAIIRNKNVDPTRRGIKLGDLTGTFGSEKKDSITRCFDYIAINAEKLGIKDLDKDEVIVHVASKNIWGSDGASSGGAITLALISAMTGKPIRGDFAMTGTIDLRGDIHQIGGLREKLTGAYEQGIRIAAIPQANAKDLLDVPDEIKKAMKIVVVKNIDDVLKIALVDPSSAQPSSGKTLKPVNKQSAESILAA